MSWRELHADDRALFYVLAGLILCVAGIIALAIWHDVTHVCTEWREVTTYQATTIPLGNGFSTTMVQPVASRQCMAWKEKP